MRHASLLLGAIWCPKKYSNAASVTMAGLLGACAQSHEPKRGQPRDVRRAGSEFGGQDEQHVPVSVARRICAPVPPPKNLWVRNPFHW